MKDEDDDLHCPRARDNEGIDNAGTGENKQVESPGYFVRLWKVVCSLLFLVLVTAGATVLCLLYVIGSILLWVCGICCIPLWVERNWKETIREKLSGETPATMPGQDSPKAMPGQEIPEAMPGQEIGDAWERAYELVKLRNHGVREDRGQTHFHVVPFLKSKTGLNMQHLMSLTKSRDERLKSELELSKVDGRLPAARISLRHLSDRAKSRAESNVQGEATDVRSHTSTRADGRVGGTDGGESGTDDSNGARNGGRAGAGAACPAEAVEDVSRGVYDRDSGRDDDASKPEEAEAKVPNDGSEVHAPCT